MDNKIPSLEELLDYGEEYQRSDFLFTDYFMEESHKKNEKKDVNSSQKMNSSFDEKISQQSSGMDEASLDGESIEDGDSLEKSSLSDNDVSEENKSQTSLGEDDDSSEGANEDELSSEFSEKDSTNDEDSGDGESIEDGDSLEKYSLSDTGASEENNSQVPLGEDNDSLEDVSTSDEDNLQQFSGMDEYSGDGESIEDEDSLEKSSLSDTDVSEENDSQTSLGEDDDSLEEASEEELPSSDTLEASTNDEDNPQQSSGIGEDGEHIEDGVGLENSSLDDTDVSEEKNSQTPLEETNEEEQKLSNENRSFEKDSPQEDENDFDDLMDNYDQSDQLKKNTNKGSSSVSPSTKLNDVSVTKVYKVLKKLVSLSYERYEKGTYKYDKKAILKHYLTNQKFKIMNDLMSPIFKPDVYVFDLSPSNDQSLEMYVNAISSVAIKDSLIYLTYNSTVLRKLIIKKENFRGFDVREVINSDVEKHRNFDCVIFEEERFLYDELKDVKDRKIYVFSDFDISDDVSKLSKEHPDMVWFSTERRNTGFSFGSDSSNLSIFSQFFHREFPSSYVGYYVDTSGIEDIEKFVMEKNKSKYRKRPK